MGPVHRHDGLAVFEESEEAGLQDKFGKGFQNGRVIFVWETKWIKGQKRGGFEEKKLTAL